MDSDHILANVQTLYDAGRYSDALAAGASLGDLKCWPAPAGRVLAGRLAANLGAPRLSRVLHRLAARQHPDHAQSVYFAAMSYCGMFGYFHAWQRYRNFELPEPADKTVRADFLAMKALILASMRDFGRAESFMIEALELDPQSAWLHVEMSELLDRQDLHEESLKAAREALALRPNYRPAVQAAGYRLVQLQRDDEALELLTSASQRLQSGEVWCQLAALQNELKQYEAAWHSLEQAEKCWPLAKVDGWYTKWLAGKRSDVAYYCGRYDEALDYAQQASSPYYTALADRLKAALDSRKALTPEQQQAMPPPRVQLPVPFVRQFHETCAPATLSGLAQYWQRPIKHEEIVERICYEGTRASDERRWADENGFHAREFRVTEDSVERLIRAKIPLTLNTVEPGSAHLQTIVGIDVYRGTWIVQDPSERHVREAPIAGLLERYASTGPRGMLMVPCEKIDSIADIELPDAQQYDHIYNVDRLLSMHDRETAAEFVSKMVQTSPDHRLTYHAQLSLARYDADSKSQLALLEKLLEQFPQDANLQLMRLGMLTDFGQRSQRIEILREACAGEYSHPIYWARLAAELLDDARDHDEAYQNLRRALRYHSNDVRSVSLLADYYWDGRDREWALECYRLAASLGEKDETQAQRYFLAARYLHQTDNALDWLRDRCQRFGHRRSSPGRTLAWALEQIDRTVESFEMVEATASQHPEDGDFQAYAALVFGRYSDFERADKYMQAAEGHCVPSVLTRSRAVLATYRGDLKTARELFLELLKSDPLDRDARERVLQLDADIDGLEVAEQRLREAVADFPHSHTLRSLLIHFLRNHRVAAVQKELDEFLMYHPRDAWSRREAAFLAMTSQNLERAEAELKVALELEPNSESGHYIAARLAERRGDIPAARKAYRRAIECNVDYTPAASGLMGTCDRPADRREQLAFLLDQLRKQTTYGEGVLTYLEVATGRVDGEQLLSELEEARSHRPDLWQTWAAVSSQCLALHKLDQAVQVAAAATERFPLLPRTWLNLALAHRRIGDHESELSALERARSINPMWSEVANELADVYIGREEYAKAEEVLRPVLAADPSDATSLATLALCMYRSGRKAEAIERLVAACVPSPGYEWGWQRLIDWSEEVDGFKSARTAAESAIKRRPFDARCYIRLAEAHHAIDDLSQGLAYIDQALQIEPRNVEAHLLRAHYFGRLHDWDAALKACWPPVFNEDVPVRLRMRRAQILHHKGRANEAIDEMKSCLKLDPDHYAGWHQLSDWADATSRYDDCLEAAQNMVRLNPHDAVPHGYLADVLIKLGQSRGKQDADAENTRDRAKEHLLRSVELSPAYGYGTAQLFDMYLEDGQVDAAQSLLKLTGEHLAAGYKQAYEVRLLDVRSSRSAQHDQDVPDYLIEWLAIIVLTKPYYGR